MKFSNPDKLTPPAMAAVRFPVKNLSRSSTTMSDFGVVWRIVGDFGDIDIVHVVAEKPSHGGNEAGFSSTGSSVESDLIFVFNSASTTTVSKLAGCVKGIDLHRSFSPERFRLDSIGVRFLIGPTNSGAEESITNRLGSVEVEEDVLDEEIEKREKGSE
ncbi:hypothetical protein G4B88_030906 [Cannabis sativa]|uniref:Uncharacterized protein n=1 Tax=Cannabis sativa TaxID=3483 RepID=A0A7J6DW91_CANSA|nr:hypothetical protein G4B88_030906 [Cannabis sativa]